MSHAITAAAAHHQAFHGKIDDTLSSNDASHNQVHSQAEYEVLVREKRIKNIKLEDL
jgi:hypothetical protein